MKTFTRQERIKIEQRIQSACPGLKFEGPKPEFFIAPGAAWPRVVRLDSLPIKTLHPHIKTVLVNQAGDTFCFGKSGLN